MKHHLQKSSVFKSGTCFCLAIKQSERSSREHSMHSLNCDSQHIGNTMFKDCLIVADCSAAFACLIVIFTQVVEEEVSDKQVFHGIVACV